MFQYRQAYDRKKLVKRYLNFMGVDFSTDPTQVDATRSPWAPNLISDNGGYPEKRSGWRTVCQLQGKVNGIFELLHKGERKLIVHAGERLYLLQGEEPQTICSDLPDARSRAVVFDTRCWLLSGGQYRVVGFEEDTPYCKHVTEIASIPNTCISRNPSGGGEMLEPVNLLCPKRTCTFLGTATDKVYALDATELDDAPLTVLVNNVQKNEGTDYTVNRPTGVITFVTAPGVPARQGADNVSVTYQKTVEGYAARILDCDFLATFGMGANDHIFVGGNQNHRNLDWHSRVDNPAYFPDTGYAAIGSTETALMGYLRVGEYLALVKASSVEDASVYLRSCNYDNERGISFSLRAGVSSVGSVASGVILNFQDDPLFLSETGVYAISSRNISQERTIVMRSTRVNARLTREPNLREATAVQWGNYLVVAVNGRCYVADARKKSQTLQSEFEYEWYHWDNIPARLLRTVGERLYFGTQDGRLCVFREDAAMSRYSDDGEAIVASWCTKADDDGDMTRYKTMPVTGSAVMLKPYTRSSIRIYLRTERDFGRLATAGNMDIFDFSELDFSRLSFNTSDSPQMIPIHSRVSSYQTLQVIVQNDGVNEGFGIFGIVRRYSFGRHIG